ncbi:hypothetical protein CsSME_00036084 [Camellia sinensis var. sinensis]
MSNIDGNICKAIITQGVVARAIQLHQRVKMKRALRSRVDHSRSFDLRRNTNQAMTIVRQGERKSSPSSDDPFNYSRMASTRFGSRTPFAKGKGPKPHHKANRDWENIRIFLELLVKEIGTGNRPHMSITQNGYRSLS